LRRRLTGAAIVHLGRINTLEPEVRLPILVQLNCIESPSGENPVALPAGLRPVK
jgi:hypothetical protein